MLFSKKYLYIYYATGGFFLSFQKDNLYNLSSELIMENCVRYKDMNQSINRNHLRKRRTGKRDIINDLNN